MEATLLGRGDIVLIALAAVGSAVVAWLLGQAVSQLPVSFSSLFMGLALGLSVVIGLVAGILPAMSAAKLDPVEALRAE